MAHLLPRRGVVVNATLEGAIGGLALVGVVAVAAALVGAVTSGLEGAFFAALFTLALFPLGLAAGLIVGVTVGGVLAVLRRAGSSFSRRIAAGMVCAAYCLIVGGLFLGDDGIGPAVLWFSILWAPFAIGVAAWRAPSLANLQRR